jgi:hypothetical protein
MIDVLTSRFKNAVSIPLFVISVRLLALESLSQVMLGVRRHRQVDEANIEHRIHLRSLGMWWRPCRSSYVIRRAIQLAFVLANTQLKKRVTSLTTVNGEANMSENLSHRAFLTSDNPQVCGGRCGGRFGERICMEETWVKVEVERTYPLGVGNSNSGLFPHGKLDQKIRLPSDFSWARLFTGRLIEYKPLADITPEHR